MHVTVCIATRDRGDRIGATLRSLQALRHKDWDAIIIDQSQQDDTGYAVLQATAGDDRFRYIRSDTCGLSAARNQAVSVATGPFVAFTDDDCEVSPDWLSSLVCCFSHHPEVGLICGEVRAGPHDPRDGFVPVSVMAHLRHISSTWMKWRSRGIGANMAFRLTTLQAIGPWDEMLGSGAPLHAGEDSDAAYRVLRAGQALVDLPSAYVVHHGFRSWAEARTLMHRSGMGIGAAYMKHLRLGEVSVLPTLLHDWIMCISWSRVLRLQKHTGIGYFLQYGWGLLTSFRYSVNRRHSVYSPRTGISLAQSLPQDKNST